MGEMDLYNRENIKSFYEWKEKPLKHFPDELGCEEQAKEFALSRPHALGFVTFKSKYRGKRYFWIEDGKADEIDPMACFLKAKSIHHHRAREMIHKVLFRR